MPHPLEQESPAVQIDDLRTFGPHRLKAYLLSAVVEQRERAAPSFDHFVDTVNDVSLEALTRGRGAVRVRFWVDARCLVATVSDEGDGFDRVVSLSSAPGDDLRYQQP